MEQQRLVAPDFGVMCDPHSHAEHGLRSGTAAREGESQFYWLGEPLRGDEFSRGDVAGTQSGFHGLVVVPNVNGKPQWLLRLDRI